MNFLLLNGNLLAGTADKTIYGLSGLFVALSGMLGIGVTALTIIISIISSIFAFLFAVLEYLIPAITLFVLAKRAGYKYPWLAFIPIAQTYLEFVLPRREFNVFLKTKKRNYMAIAYLVMTYFGTSIIVALNVVPVVGQLLDVALPIVLMALAWRKRYDMLVTFRDKELALPISIISVFFPWLYSIVLLLSIKKEPEYGEGNYYQVVMED